MSNTVKCVLLKKELPALAMQPLPGPLGTKIYQNVSAEAWQQWLSHQTMLINEKRLSLGKAEDRKYLSEQVEKFFFGGDVDKPAGYIPPEEWGTEFRFVHFAKRFNKWKIVVQHLQIYWTIFYNFAFRQTVPLPLFVNFSDEFGKDLLFNSLE